MSKEGGGAEKKLSTPLGSTEDILTTPTPGSTSPDQSMTRMTDSPQKSFAGSDSRKVHSRTSSASSSSSSSRRQQLTKILRQHGIDVNQFSAAVEGVERIVSNCKEKKSKDVDAHSDSPQPSANNCSIAVDAWNEYVDLANSAFSDRIDGTVGKLFEENSARKQAELLSNLAEMGFTYPGALPERFGLSNLQAEQILALLADILAFSASSFMKGLALRCVAAFICCRQFLRAFFDAKGPWLICKCWDDEGAKDQAYARQVVTELCRQGFKAWERQQQQQTVIKQLSVLSLSTEDLNPEDLLMTFPVCFVNRLLSYIDPNDPMSAKGMGRDEVRWAVSTLCTVLRYAPKAVAACDGIRQMLFYTLHQDNQSLVREVVDAVVSVYEDPSTRAFVHDDDLGVLFSPFTENNVGDPRKHLTTMKRAVKILVYLLRSWTGVFWMASEGTGLKSLVDIIHLPGPIVRKMVLLEFFSSLLVAVAPHRGLPESGPWTGVEAEESKELKRQLQPENKRHANTDYDFELLDESPASNIFFQQDAAPEQTDAAESIPTNTSVGYHVLDPFLGVLMLLLDVIGLPKALMSVIKSTNEDTNQGLLPQAAAQLLQEVLGLMDTNLPHSHVKTLHQCFNAVIAKLAARDDGFVSAMTTKLFHNVLDQPVGSSGATGSPNHSGGCGGGGGNPQYAIKGNIVQKSSATAFVMDDTTFQANVKESHVEGDFSRWNFESIQLLIHGPLRQAARLRYVRDRTQFFPRLLLFYKPGRGGFAALKRDEVAAVAGQVGIHLVELLLSSKDGVDILDRSELVKDLNTILEDILQHRSLEGTPAATHTEYLAFLQRLTSTPNGLQLLSKTKVFVTLHQIFEQQITVTDSLTAVCHELLQHLYFGAVPNHGICQEAQTALMLALGSASNPVRLSAVTQLKKAMWRDLSLMLRWGMDRLLERLTDTFDLIVESCFSMLVTITATSEEALDYLIEKAPAQLLSDTFLSVARSRRKMDLQRLLFRIVGKVKGFDFLFGIGWVETELERWKEEYCSYVQALDAQASCFEEMDHGPRHASIVHARTASEVERRLQRTPPPARNQGDDDDAALDVIPLHFLGELCRTEAGKSFFESSDLWKILCNELLEGTAVRSRDLGSPLDRERGGASPESAFRETPECNNLSLSSFDLVGSFVIKPGGTSDGDHHETSGSPLLDSTTPPLRPLSVSPEPAGDEHNILLLSATREVMRKTSSMELSLAHPGRILSVRGAMVALASMCSSDVGFKFVSSKPNIIARIVSLAQFATHPILKGTALFTLSLVARSDAGAQFLTKLGFAVNHTTSAYVSKDGVPYSLSFSHPPIRESGAEWMLFRRHDSHVTSSMLALAETEPVNREPVLTHDNLDFPLFRIPNFAKKPPAHLPQELLAAIGSLSNTLTPTAGKRAKLIRAEHLGLFQNLDVLLYLMWFSAAFRLRSDARKVICDCLNQRIPIESSSRSSHQSR